MVNSSSHLGNFKKFFLDLMANSDLISTVMANSDLINTVMANSELVCPDLVSTVMSSHIEVQLLSYSYYV